MIPFEHLINDLIFRLTSLNGLGYLDIALVTFVYLIALLILQRSRVAYLLRGIIFLGIFLLIVALFLPLPTFDWIINTVFIVILIATPVIFAPEIRRLLENIGRTVGLSRSVQATTAETVIPTLIRSLESLSSQRTGALIVLEAGQSLDDIIKTGIPVNGRVSSELLQTIFHDKTPLHDGAVIIRGETIVAAGCVLPLTEQHLNGNRRRFGTRHRAAVGISEATDAFTMVVSEETGHISTTYKSELHANLDILDVRNDLGDFYTGRPDEEMGKNRVNIWPALRQSLRKGRGQFKQIGVRNFLVTLLLAAVLAFFTWAYVLSVTNPTQQETVADVPLMSSDFDDNLVLMNALPKTVDVRLQSTAELMPSLDTSTVLASVDLAGLGEGIHDVPVVISTTVEMMEIVEVTPPMVQVELVETITQTFPVTVNLTMRSLSAAYEIIGEPTSTPAAVQVSGPKPYVEKVAAVLATLSVDNPTSSIEEIRPLTAVDEHGRIVTGVQLSDSSAQVALGIAQRQDARDVGVRAITSGAPPDGYWLSGLSTTPSSITIQGDTAVLDQTGTFIDTLPIDVSQATGQLQIEIPLDIPEELQATDENGQSVRTVKVNVQVSVRNSDLAITRTVEIMNPPIGITPTVVPETVDLLLSGPLPTLQKIEADPSLVRVFINAANLEAEQKYDIIPEIIVPDKLRVQLAPRSITVTTFLPEEEAP